MDKEVQALFERKFKGDNDYLMEENRLLTKLLGAACAEIAELKNIDLGPAPRHGFDNRFQQLWNYLGYKYPVFQDS